MRLCVKYNERYRMCGCNYEVIGISSLWFANYNNIKGDTEKIVIDYKCGINISKVDYEHEIDKLLSVDDDEYEKMRNAARCVYSEFFSPQSYYSKMNDFYLKIIGKE